MCMAANQIALVQLIPLGNRPARLGAGAAVTAARPAGLMGAWSGAAVTGVFSTGVTGSEGIGVLVIVISIESNGIAT